MIIGVSEYAYIYILIDPLTNQIRYVGKANDPRKRLSQTHN